MPKRISDVFQVDAKELSNHNVFNGFIDIDSTFYVDPRLLSKTSINELQKSYNKFTNYFNDVLKFALFYIEKRGSFETIVKKLMFPEIPLVGLGYSINNNKGKGIGKKLATNLATTVIEFVKQGILDPTTFEIIELFEIGIGADRVSDMTINILLPELVQFSCRIARELNLPKSHSTSIGKQDFKNLPCYSNQGILLIPQDILTSLPLADSWSNSESIIIHNDKLRKDVNKIVNNIQFHSSNLYFKKLFKQKNFFTNLLLKNPELMEELIECYKAKSAMSYDFINDPNDEFRWHDKARDYAKRFPLNLKSFERESNEKLINLICQHFSKLVKNGLNISFYQYTGEPSKEIIGQLILLELLEVYTEKSCFVVNYDIENNFICLYNSNLNIKNKIVVKYTSTKRLGDFYKIQHNLSILHQKIHENFKITQTITTLILIILNEGEAKARIINKIDLKYETNNFFRRFNVDCRNNLLNQRR